MRPNYWEPQNAPSRSNKGGDRNDGQDGGKDDVVGVGDVEWLI